MVISRRKHQEKSSFDATFCTTLDSYIGIAPRRLL